MPYIYVCYCVCEKVTRTKLKLDFVLESEVWKKLKVPPSFPLLHLRHANKEFYSRKS